VPARRSSASDLPERVISAAIAIPIVLVANSLGGVAFALVVAFAAIAGAHEFCRLTRSAGYRPAMPICLVAAPVLAILPLSVHDPQSSWIVALFIVMLGSGIYYLMPELSPVGLVGWATTIVGVMYTGLLLGYISLLRQLNHGARWVVVLLVITWAYDTGAYFAGKSFGVTAFMAHVSAKKTWEGVTGGLILAGLTGFVTAPFVSLHFWQGGLMGVVLGVVCQTGDLFASMVKRQAGVKDSGSFMPGHGGLLDRIDGLLFTGAAAYYAAVIFGHGP
jgi:phosphatidate cytidylyltransferase